MPADNTPAVDLLDQADLERYARAAARVAGLQIDEAWWPGVVGHLDGMMRRAASLEGLEGLDGLDGLDGLEGLDPLVLPGNPAPVFAP